MIRGGSAPLKSLRVPVRFTCDPGTVRFQPNSFEWAEITPDRSKSSACTTFYGNHSNQIAWYFCTMQSGAGKCTVFATHVWSVISLTLTLAADRNCNAFWTQGRKAAQNACSLHCVLVQTGHNSVLFRNSSINSKKKNIFALHTVQSCSTLCQIQMYPCNSYVQCH